MSESESKELDKIKCPDCGKKLRNADSDCAHCQTPAADKPAEEMAETKPSDEKKRKGSRFAKPRILLIGIVSLALVAVSASGLFYFLKDSATQESGEIGSASVAETDIDEENEEQKENSSNEMSLEDILASHYQKCQVAQEDILVGQPFVGYQSLQTCVREGANGDGAPTILQVYSSENPNETVAFAAAYIFCTEELGNELLVIRGEQFLIMPVVALDSQVIAETQDPFSIFTPEYIQTLNDTSKEEQVFLKNKGLGSELINACEELGPV